MSDKPQTGMTLTQEDMAAIREMFLQSQVHSCRFRSLTREDADFIKDLIGIYKETRSELIKWVVKGIIYVTVGAVIFAAWLKYSGGRSIAP